MNRREGRGDIAGAVAVEGKGELHIAPREGNRIRTNGLS